MSRKLRIAYFAHTLRSDWNNGNAHFLRGLVRAMGAIGHDIVVYEPETEWSIENLQTEPLGPASLTQFSAIYPDLKILTYAHEDTEEMWQHRLADVEIVILHEWNTPAFAHLLLRLRDLLGFRMLFHDTHHRASSSPQQMQCFGLDRFDGILAFGESLRAIYRDRLGLTRVWTLHEAADITLFHPIADSRKQTDVVWIGNWGDGERASEISDFLLKPAANLASVARFTIYGVRYPDTGLAALHNAGVEYRGYLPNLDAPSIYARARLTLHIPRQQYSLAMTGIPTIRVFEALACGIPVISAPWQDTEHLFRPGDYCMVSDAAEMTAAIRTLLDNPAQAMEQAQRGLETVLARHTCTHRAHELTAICQELLA